MTQAPLHPADEKGSKTDLPPVHLLDLTCRTLPYDAHLASALRAQGVDLTAWIAGGLRDQKEKYAAVPREALVDWAGGLPINWRLRKYAKAAEYLINVAALQRRMRCEEVGILHVQWLPFLDRMPRLEWWNLRSACAAGAKLVYTVHNVLPHDTGRRYAETYEAVYHYVDALICHTHASKRRLVKEFGVPEENIWVIPHGPLAAGRSDVTQAQARAALENSEERFTALLFGRLHPYKGIKFLLRAWKKVAARRPEARLVLAGSGEEAYLAELSSLIQLLGLTNQVETHFRFVPDQELGLLIQAADVLVYPYESITQSGALLTGMAAGKAIVATAVGGFRETLHDGENSLLVEYGNEEALADAVQLLCDDAKTRARLGAAVRELLRTEYSWASIARRTAHCYAAVLEG